MSRFRSPRLLPYRPHITSLPPHPTSMDPVQLSNQPIHLPQRIPLHTLPLELLQTITTSLSTPDAASFSLTSRYLLYATGIHHLKTYLLKPGTKKHEYRKKVAMLERAFPSSWYCAWCDRFHGYEKGGGPREFGKEEKRKCVVANGYLADGEDYRLCFHHVRLTILRDVMSGDAGIGLEELAYVREGKVRLGRSSENVKVTVDARIVSGRLLLYSTCTISLRRAEKALKWGRLKKIMALIPQIVGGHRNDKKGHSNLKVWVGKVLKHGWKIPLQRCLCCPTEYHVGCERVSSAHEEHVVLEIKTWRDLGDGKNPFESAWRAHGQFTEINYETKHIPLLAKGGIRGLYEINDPIIQTSKENASYPFRIAQLFEYPVTPNWSKEIQRLRVIRVRAMADPALRSHQLRVVENNENIKANGPLYIPPYGLSWDQFVDLGGMRGNDGIPLIDVERRELISEHGIWGGLIEDLKHIDMRRERYKIKQEA